MSSNGVPYPTLSKSSSGSVCCFRPSSFHRDRKGVIVVTTIFLLVVVLSESRSSSSSSRRRSQRKVQSFDLHPTSQLLHIEQGRNLLVKGDNDNRRKRKDEEEEEHAVAAVYAGLQEIPPLCDESYHDSSELNHKSLRGLPLSRDGMEHDDLIQKHNALVQEYNSLRHLSPHERKFRLENQLDLWENWDGLYRFHDDDDDDDDDDVKKEVTSSVTTSSIHHNERLLQSAPIYVGGGGEGGGKATKTQQQQQQAKTEPPKPPQQPQQQQQQQQQQEEEEQKNKEEQNKDQDDKKDKDDANHDNDDKKEESPPKSSDNKDEPPADDKKQEQQQDKKQDKQEKDIVIGAPVEVFGGPGPVIPPPPSIPDKAATQNKEELDKKQAEAATAPEQGDKSSEPQQQQPQDEQEPKAEEQDEQLRGGLFNTYQTAPLCQGYGTHYATVWVGSPQPQRKSVIVDTGSHYTAFPCRDCKNCGEEHHTDLYFDPDKSKTFRALSCKECRSGSSCSGGKCMFSQSYTEGSSWHAYQAVDRFFCGGTDVLAAENPVDNEFAIDFMFGCQTSETGLFVTQLADGIMGMSAHVATLPKQMFDAGKLEHNMFSLCFRRELNVSKQGVNAGVMTLGGIDSRLDITPMLYAKNLVHTGWFTVYIKKIYFRTNGGQSAQSDDPESQQIIPLPINVNLVNSGKGVIVDSGTTDTYLHTSLARTFGDMWIKVVGKSYNNNPIKLTKKDLLSLPTILIQVSSFDSKPDPSIASYDSIPGYVGEKIDPASPHDVLIAIPATHYMEYAPAKDEYTSRLYFSESRGGVLGANAMQGHNILFDWENQRIGFAESNCDYIAEAPKDEGNNPEGNEVDEAGVQSDCRLGPPSLSVSCLQTVDLSLCSRDSSQTLVGTERWIMVVENAGTSKGKSCEDVALEKLSPSSENDEPPTVACDGKGICTEIRPCEVTCASAEAAGEIIPEPSEEEEEEKGESVIPCGDNLWGACEYSCTQSKITSVLMSDGVCHEQNRTTRPCHVGACGRSDPCRVPFLVHAILVFRGANATLWQRAAEEYFAVALKDSVNAKRENDKDELFGAGDVNVLMAVPWYVKDESPQTITVSEEESEEDEVLGMKLIVEISIFNPNARLPPDLDEGEEDESQAGKDSNSTSSGENKKSHNGIVQKIKNAMHINEPPAFTCKESDLYPLAKTALDVHNELGRKDFMPYLVTEMIKWDLAANKDSPSDLPQSPFKDMYGNPDLAKQSKVVTSWTIKTEIDEQGKDLGGLDIEAIKKNSPYMAIVGFMLMCVCVCGVCCGRTICAPKIVEKVNQLKERREDMNRGVYSKIGETPNGIDDEEEGEDVANGFPGETSEYRDNKDSINGDEELAFASKQDETEPNEPSS